MNALHIENYSFAYPGQIPLLKEISLELEAGSFTLLVGSTGSGKTTLLRSIKPELAPGGVQSGVITLFGKDVKTLDTFTSATTIGFVAQNPEAQIVCDTVWHELAFGLENIGIGQEAMRRRIAEVAHFFGIESLMHVKTDELSGGQKQEVTLGSALAMQPHVLLLDEPTAQLDPVAEKNFIHALYRVNKELGITIVVATHSPETMGEYATQIVRLQNGCLKTASLEEYRGAAFLNQNSSPVKPDPIMQEMTRGNSNGNCFQQETSGLGFSATGQIDEGRLKKNLQTPVAIKCNDVFYRYTREDPWVLRGMDISVQKGSIHALVGGNGSGKSTLLQVIAGTLKPQRGYAENQLKANQALLPQDAKTLFVCDSVEEELSEWQQRCGYSNCDIKAVADKYGLCDFWEQHPYDLSGGQQQKLALAKLLLTSPNLLLLDEPTKGLDAHSQCEVAEMLLNLKKEGMTMLLVTHDLAFASVVTDMSTMLFDGENACTEPTSMFFENNIFYKPSPNRFLQKWCSYSAPTPKSSESIQEEDACKKQKVHCDVSLGKDTNQ